MSLGELREAAILATIIDRVSKSGRFCGETLLQKSTFFLKELFGVPFTPTFRLYHYGPFSFDLRDELRWLEAVDVVRIQPHEFGATYVVGDRYAMLQRQFPETPAQYEKPIDFIVRELRQKALRTWRRWPRLSTSRRIVPALPPEERALELTMIKPHVDMSRARASVARVDEWMRTMGTAA